MHRYNHKPHLFFRPPNTASCDLQGSSVMQRMHIYDDIAADVLVVSDAQRMPQVHFKEEADMISLNLITNVKYTLFV